MVKCVVSSCPNRTESTAHETLHRPPKRFFCIPADPARVQLWLAALRQMEGPDWTEQHLICEDHFLPEDLTMDRIHDKATPITSFKVDSDLGLTSSSEGEGEGVCDVGTEAGQQSPPVGGSEHRADLGYGAVLGNPVGTSRAEPPQRKDSAANKGPRCNFSLGVLTRRFLQLLWAAPDGWLDIRQVASSLQTGRRRVYDITNVLEGIKLLQKDSGHRIRGKPLQWKNQQQLQKELQKLKQVEDTLDFLIKTCAQQLFDLTDDTHNSASAYVTLEDLAALHTMQEETLIIIKAPEETKLEIPAPKEDGIQVHLKAGKGPIAVSTCEIGSIVGVASNPVRTESGFFMTLEQSRVRIRDLHTWKR